MFFIAASDPVETVAVPSRSVTPACVMRKLLALFVAAAAFSRHFFAHLASISKACTSKRRASGYDSRKSVVLLEAARADVDEDEAPHPRALRRRQQLEQVVLPRLPQRLLLRRHRRPLVAVTGSIAAVDARERQPDGRHIVGASRAT